MYYVPLWMHALGKKSPKFFILPLSSLLTGSANCRQMIAVDVEELSKRSHHAELEELEFQHVRGDQ